jgi:hypothetical protein
MSSSMEYNTCSPVLKHLVACMHILFPSVHGVLRRALQRCGGPAQTAFGESKASGTMHNNNDML